MDQLARPVGSRSFVGSLATTLFEKEGKKELEGAKSGVPDSKKRRDVVCPFWLLGFGSILYHFGVAKRQASFGKSGTVENAAKAGGGKGQMRKLFERPIGKLALIPELPFIEVGHNIGFRGKFRF